MYKFNSCVYVRYTDIRNLYHMSIEMVNGTTSIMYTYDIC